MDVGWNQHWRKDCVCLCVRVVCARAREKQMHCKVISNNIPNAINQI